MNQVTVKRRAFFARTGNLLSTENPTFSARMMVAIVSKRGLAAGWASWGVMERRMTSAHIICSNLTQQFET